MKLQANWRRLLVVLAITNCGVLANRETDGASKLPVRVLPGEMGQVCPDSTGVRDDIIKEARQVLMSSSNCTSQVTKLGSCNCQCGSEGGKWRRIAFLDMSDNTMTCPSLGAWREVTAPVRSCKRSTVVGCSSAFFPNNGQQYSRVCGRIIGHQVNTPDGFADRAQGITLEDNYLDGVSVTRGSPRQHIWSLTATNGDRPENKCPCIATATSVTPGYVGSDFFCETGRDMNDPVWDGKGCEPNKSCECSFNNPPWFCRELGDATNENIEIRICGDQDHGDEQTPVEQIEIYVQ